ncbi:hypothetical protein Pcinc_034652 [Petrolisthes cinctipes]|uniref:Uncharacterized protein n=1 Tax=Petrolisthes cinctipes TaxID=88211 RepID=A0AAE1BY78_PETCI|nr:hypothetical protein Pcinc_034652 [Petrolisthes cinctipes]
MSESEKTRRNVSIDVRDVMNIDVYEGEMCQEKDQRGTCERREGEEQYGEEVKGNGDILCSKMLGYIGAWCLASPTLPEALLSDVMVGTFKPLDGNDLEGPFTVTGPCSPAKSMVWVTRMANFLTCRPRFEENIHGAWWR